jgi:hypothetical protein
VNATIVPEIGRVKNTVQSLPKLIMVFTIIMLLLPFFQQWRAKRAEVAQRGA